MGRNKRGRNLNSKTPSSPKENLKRPTLLDSVFKVILWVVTFIFGTGLIWQLLINQPNLTIELGKSGGYPLNQELVLKNSGKRTAVIGGVYLTEIRLRTNEFFWNQKETSAGPVLNSVDYELTPDQTFKFSLDSFNGNLPGMLFNRQFKSGVITLQIRYYDTLKWKWFYREAYFYYGLRNGQWEQMGSFSKKYLYI